MPSSESDSQPAAPSLQGFSERGVPAFLPWVLRMVGLSAPQAHHSRDVMVLLNQAAGSITVIEGFAGDWPGKEGPVPASKASIESMPVVQVTETGLECPICLTDFELNEEGKEMPCKHKFHSGCIDKWLHVNGSCPVCRHQMPVEERKETSGEEDGNERGAEPEVRIHMFLLRGEDRREEGPESGLGSGNNEPETMDLD